MVSFRSIAIRLVAYSAAAYLAVGAFLYLKQGEFLFPAPKDYEKVTPAASGLPFEDVRIPVKANSYLHAWWLPAAPPSPKTVLIFHGNGYVLEQMARDEAVRLHEIGANLMLVDYRGYGSSTAVSPTEATVDEDAEAALGYLLRLRDLPISNVYLLGRSIGSGPATYLAAHHQGLGGLILESPFTSIDDAAAGSWYFHLYPIGLLLRSHFDNLARIRSVRAPLLIVDGTADTLTPVWMAERLLAQAQQPKEIYLIPGAGHDDLLSVGGSALTEVLRKFVATAQ